MVSWGGVKLSEPRSSLLSGYMLTLSIEGVKSELMRLSLHLFQVFSRAPSQPRDRRLCPEDTSSPVL